MADDKKIIQPIDATLDQVVDSIFDVQLTKPAVLKTLAGSKDRPLQIGEASIDCYVLEDETRVLSQRGMFKGLGVARGGPRNENEPSHTGAEIPRFASQNWLKPYINNDLELALKSPIFFQPPTGHMGYGYPAEILVDICDAILEAHTKGATGKPQEGIVNNASALMRGFAKLGIIGLVDEVTGYQEMRAKNALAIILESFLSDYRQKWAKTFPDDFYRQIYRLKDWAWDGSARRPGVVGGWTNNFVYDRLAPSLTDELKRLNPTNPKGERLAKHHQWFNPEFGHPALKEHIAGVLALMKASATWEGFKRSIDRAYPRYGETIELPLDDI
jgi:P63C domain